MAAAAPPAGKQTARVGAPSKGYHSYKRGSWRVVVLDSNCSGVGGCGTHSPQGRWLKQFLTNYPSRCALAYFHHPLFVSTGAAVFSSLLVGQLTNPNR